MEKNEGPIIGRPKIIVCIPAYNAAKNIEDVIIKAKNYSDEVIVCDDGSADNTFDVARDAGAIVISHSRNQGYGKAIRTLFQTALARNAEVIVTLDSDGQHNAEQIPTVVEPILSNGVDIVIGSRFISYNDRAKVPFYRSVGIKAITKVTNRGTYGNLTDAQSGFRGYSRKALEQINLVGDGMSISTEILLRAGVKNLTIKEVPITVKYDVNKSSTHNFLSHGIRVFFSVLQFISLQHPLVFYGLPGIVSLVLSGIFAYSSLDLFTATRFVSINMILLSIATAVIGIVLLTTGSILFTIAAMLYPKSGSNVLSGVLQFISFHHPLVFYGLPGIASLVISGIYAFNALDYFSSSRYVTSQLTNMLFVTVGTAVTGIVLLTAGSMLFSITAMLRGKIRLD